MRHKRASGILLHPTCLPGRFGIGDIGPVATEFLDFLVETGQHWWQMLPLGPAGGSNSPYQSHSSFAGNPLLISPERMVDEGYLLEADLPGPHRYDGTETRIDFDAVRHLKEGLLRHSFERFDPANDSDYGFFVTKQAEWLDDYSLYMALKAEHHEHAWYEWEPAMATRRPDAMEEAKVRLDAEVRYHKFVQYLFFRQWRALRDSCRHRNIDLIGDLPIYVADDSADVWARPDLFHLDISGRPTVVAGVPPDLFSPEFGQRWGNPLYHWEAHKAEHYAWWFSRLRASIDRVDVVRLDHFRGFEAYWEVPASSPTAAVGRWVEAPGVDFLTELRNHLGGLPLVAEDLGVITDKVEKLRDDFGLPGMKILQFAFGASHNDEQYLPYRHVPHCVVYTGTHDNDTTVGWYYMTPGATGQSSEQVIEEREFVRRVIGHSDEPIHWAMTRLAYSSVADTVIIPLQDILGLGSTARMNIPGEATGHWGWRFEFSQVTPEVRTRLAELTFVYGRWNGELPPHFRRIPGFETVNPSVNPLVS
jgi:4-alpha-glucanotransferase